MMRRTIEGISINEQIRSKEVRVVNFDGSMLGILATNEALERARGVKLDLVEVSPNAEPPVCKIIDYGKYKYELQKKKNETKKKQKVVLIKEIKITLRIESNDYNVKINRASEFLSKGNKVKVSLRFRGREAEHFDKAVNLLQGFYDKIEGVEVKQDLPPKREGRQVVMILSQA